MRAHSQRRLIWLLNVALGAALVGVLAWYVLTVRPAVADPTYLQPRFAAAAVETFRSRDVRDESALRPSISADELKQIDRPEFKTHGGQRFHWAYSGPVPPAPPEDRVEAQPRGPIEDDLEKLGRVRMLLYVPPDPGDDVAAGTVVFWQFKGDAAAKIAVSPGDWVHEPKSPKPKSIKLANVRPDPPGSGRYLLVYEVYEDPDGKPIKTGELPYDGTMKLDDDLDRRVRSVSPATGGDAEASAGPRPSAPGGSDYIVVGGSGSRGPSTRPRARDLKPRVDWEGNSAQVTFDQSTYDYLRNADADEIAGSVKTQAALDGRGNVYGITITGISSDTPADKFDIKPGDVLISINDQPVRSRSDAINIVQGIDPNTSRVKVVVERRGNLLTYNIDPRDPKTRRRAATTLGRNMR